MPSIRGINPVLRATGVIGAVAILVSGVTFAAIESQVVLADNSISTTGASGLVIDNDTTGEDGDENEPGFAFSDLVPGDDDFSAEQAFSLANTSDADMTLTVHALGASTQGIVDKNHVYIRFELADGNGEDDDDDDAETVDTQDGDDLDPSEDVATYSLADLESDTQPLPGVSGEDELDGNEEETFDISVRVGADAVNQGSVTISGLDLVFTGTTVDEEDGETDTDNDPNGV